MGGQNSWRTQQSGADWMRDIEKRILHEERRPNIRTASDILGPGISPFSVFIQDWNAPETAFNGFFHSQPGSINSPDNTKYWMGTSQATADGYGIQRVSQYSGTPPETVPTYAWVRLFFTVSGSQRQFTTWKMEEDTDPAPTDTGWLELVGWASGWVPAGGAGGPLMWQARQVANVVYLRGNVKNDTFTGNNTPVASLPPAITPPSQTSGFDIVGSSVVKWGSVLSTGVVQVTAATATSGSWMQIVGYYLTD